MLHLSNYELRMELEKLRRDLDYHYGQFGFQNFNDQFHSDLYNWKIARFNALETYVNAQFMVCHMEQQLRYAANPRPRWRSKPKRKQLMPKNQYNCYNNNNYNAYKPPNNANTNNAARPFNNTAKPFNNGTTPLNNATRPSKVTKPSNNVTILSNKVIKPPNNATVSNNVTKQPNNATKPPNNATKPPNNATKQPNNATKPPNNVTTPQLNPKTSEPTPPVFNNVQIKQERFDSDDLFIVNIKQEKPDNGYENVTEWVQDVNQVLNIKKEKVDDSYEGSRKRKCDTTNDGNPKKAKCNS